MGVIASLSGEDTDDDAIDRLFSGMAGVWGDYQDVGGLGCVGTPPPCCLAVWEQRTSGFTLAYQEAQFRGVQAGLTPGATYTMDVNIYRRAYGSLGAFTLFSTITVSAAADITGTATFEGDVPNDVGYETYASC